MHFADTMNSENSKGDFIKLLLSNYRQIFSFILVYVPNRSDAEDLMQETASWLWEHFDDYVPGTNFGAWGRQVARFKILRLKSNTQNSRVKFQGDLVELIDTRAESVLEKSDYKVDALRSCLSAMNDRDRQLVYLRYEEGLSPQKLAQLVERPVHGIYKTMARIHKLLLRCIRHKLIAEDYE